MSVRDPKDEGQALHLREWFQAGVAAAQARRFQQARNYLRQVIAWDPQNEEAWLWLAGVTDDPQETLACLAQALTINPRNQHAKAAIRWARARLVKETTSAGFIIQRSERKGHLMGRAVSVLGRISSRWPIGVLIAILLLGLTLLATIGTGAERTVFGPPGPGMNPTATSLPTATPIQGAGMAGFRSELDQAWQTGDWQRVLDVLEQIQVVDPGYEGLQPGLFTAHLLRGLELVETNQLEEAIVHFEQALAIRPDDPTAQSQRQAAVGYLAGLKSYRQADWDRAVEELTAVYNMDPDYKEVSSWLYSAHLNRGLAMQGQGQLTEAQKEYQRALEIMSDGQDAKIKLAEVTFLLTPPTPTPRPVPHQRIEVDISEQHLYAYEGNTLVYSFVCSTGEPGRDTVPGQYQVLDKIPMAYASTWNLKMPYWLGIYWAGTLENGIHALPILPGGQKLWDGYLGQRVSYGCIILSTEAARALYEWAEIGTPVIIRP